MKNFRFTFAASLLMVLVFTLAQAQQSSSDKASSDTSQKSQAKKDSADAKAKTDTAAKPTQADGQRSVMDRPMDEKVEPIVVPAGTEIRVDIAEGKVAVPVRVGFSTPIPALSKVSVKIDRVYAPAVYDANGNVLNNSNTRYAEYGVLTGVTVNGVTYKVETDSVPLATPGSGAVTVDNSMGSSVHDVKFVLSAPIEIAR